MMFGSENKEFLIFMPNIPQLFWKRIFFLSNKDEAGYFVSSETEIYANQACRLQTKLNLPAISGSNVLKLSIYTITTGLA